MPLCLVPYGGSSAALPAFGFYYVCSWKGRKLQEQSYTAKLNWLQMEIKYILLMKVVLTELTKQ